MQKFKKFPSKFKDTYQPIYLKWYTVGDFFRFTNGSLVYRLLHFDRKTFYCEYEDKNGRVFTKDNCFDILINQQLAIVNGRVIITFNGRF